MVQPHVLAARTPWRRNHFRLSSQCHVCEHNEKAVGDLIIQLHATPSSKPGSAYRTTRSRWRRRSDVLMREIPSYGTRWSSLTSKRISCAWGRACQM
eukprot:3142605-Prymnesium_polylepis.1